MPRSDDKPRPGSTERVDWLRGGGQMEFDREFYADILMRNPDNTDVLRRQVELLARCGDYEEALVLDRRLVDLSPRDFIARYNLACSLSMLGHVNAALEALDDALRLGYSDFVHLEDDSDLDAIRHSVGYFRILRKYGLAD